MPSAASARRPQTRPSRPMLTLIDAQRRIEADLAHKTELVRQARVRAYGTTPYMRFFLMHFQHRMVWPEVPTDLLEATNQQVPEWYGRPGSFVPPAPVHYELAAVLDEALGRLAPTRKLVEVFRGCGKSTMVTEAGLIYAVIKGRKNILLISATADEASARLQSVTHELIANEQLLAEYPELQRGKDDKGQWISYTDKQIVFANGARIRAYPMRAKLRGSLWNGYRPDFVLIDDPESDEMQVSDSEMIKARRWVNRSLLPALAAHCALVWVGTPLSPNCLLYWIRKDKGWKGPRQAAHNEDGSPHWPHFWPEGRLQFVLDEIKEHAYQQEFELNSLPDDEAVFRPEHFDDHYFNPGMLSGIGTRALQYNGRAVTVYGWWDSAISLKDKAARTAIVIVGRVEGPTVTTLVLDVRVGRWQDDTQKEQLQDVHRIWQPLQIGAQNTLLEKAIGPAALRQFGVPFVGYPLSQAKDAKHARIKSLVPHLKEGQLLFNHEQPAQMEELRPELMNYPWHPTKDILDALEGAFKLALAGGNPTNTQAPSRATVRQSYRDKEVF